MNANKPPLRYALFAVLLLILAGPRLATASSGSSGSDTALAQIAAATLGVGLDAINIVAPDTPCIDL